MDWHRFSLQMAIVASAVGLTTLLALQPNGLHESTVEILKYSVTSLWTLVAFIARDVRNREGPPKDHSKPD